MTHLKEEAGSMMFEFAEENSHLDSDRLADIKVIGVGGAGGNAVGRMIEAGLVGVEFFAVNTDLQALQDSPAHRTLQIGALRTKGLGSGGNPSVGRAAAEEDLEHLRESLAGADMVFVTAGMGGGTGTGAAPVIARVARELGALTVAIVTKPFRFEASVRMQQALAGIEELRQSVDTLIIIPNQRLLEVVPANTSMREAFRIADNVLYEATRGIYEIISRHDHVNLDFADVRTVMKDMGQAMMGTGRAEGPNRAVEAARQAISSPLLENVDIRGSRAVLVNVLGREVGLQDTAEAMEYIQEAAGPQAHVIFGYGNDESMGEMLQLTVIATGFDAARDDAQPFTAAVTAAPVETAAEAIVPPETAETGDAMPESAVAAGPIMTYVDSDAIGADEIWTEPWPASTLAGDEAIEEAAAAEAAARIAAELEERAREEQELLELEAQLLALEEEELRLAAEAAEAEEAARLLAEEEARLAAEAEEAARLQAAEEARLAAEAEAAARRLPKRNCAWPQSSAWPPKLQRPRKPRDCAPRPRCAIAPSMKRACARRWKRACRRKWRPACATSARRACARNSASATSRNSKRVNWPSRRRCSPPRSPRPSPACRSRRRRCTRTRPLPPPWRRGRCARPSATCSPSPDASSTDSCRATRWPEASPARRRGSTRARHRSAPRPPWRLPAQAGS
jgi:cell division protein FtsZ